MRWCNYCKLLKDKRTLRVKINQFIPIIVNMFISFLPSLYKHQWEIHWLKCVLLNKMRDRVVAKCSVCTLGELVVRCFTVNLSKFTVHRWTTVTREPPYLTENSGKRKNRPTPPSLTISVIKGEVTPRVREITKFEDNVCSVQHRHKSFIKTTPEIN